MKLKIHFLHANVKVFFPLVLVFIALLSCKNGTVQDPPGTVSVNINTTVNPTPVVLYNDTIEDGDYYLSGTDTVPFDSSLTVCVYLGIDNNINFQVVHHYGESSNWGWFDREGGEFADVGAVSGLGDVTSIPQSGWAKSVAATKGHGYVLRYKHSININDTTFTMYYARLYVEDYLVSSTTGGIIGIKLKYKDPF